MWQILYAFGAGLIAATISNYITEKQDPILEPEEMNAEQLREELKLTRDQRTRAFHVIAFLLVGLWLCVVSLPVWGCLTDVIAPSALGQLHAADLVCSKEVFDGV